MDQWFFLGSSVPTDPRRSRTYTGEDVRAGQTVEMNAGQAKAEGKAEHRHIKGSDRGWSTSTLHASPSKPKISTGDRMSGHCSNF